jgi:hypothetical protein
VLLDCDRRRESLEPVHLRFRHPVEELFGVGGQRLDVAPLAFGVERIERKRRLPRAGRPGDHDQRAVGQVDGDAAEVVLSRVDDTNGGLGHRWR